MIGADPISATDALAWGLQSGPSTSMSYVGVNGFAAGDGFSTDGPNGEIPGGGLKGYLSPDNNLNYTYMAAGPALEVIASVGGSISYVFGPVWKVTWTLPHTELAHAVNRIR